MQRARNGSRKAISKSQHRANPVHRPLKSSPLSSATSALLSPSISQSRTVNSVTTQVSRNITSSAISKSSSGVASRRLLQSSISGSQAPFSIPSRGVSKNTSEKLVKTKKRLMLEIPAPQEVVDLGVKEGTTAFEQDTKFAQFYHPMPDVKTTVHPLLDRPNIPHANQMFAIIDVNGFQYKVTKDDEVMVHHLKGVEIGEQLAFEHVHLLASRDFTLLGKPYVPNVSVVATVEEHTMLAPVNVWRYKRRTGYRNLNRHRDHVTILRIEDIQLDDPSIIPQVEPLQSVPVVQVKPVSEQADPAEATPQ